MELLEIFIGLFFTYLLLSLFASIILELVSGITSLRGRVLIQALAKLLEFEEIPERILLKRYLKHQSSSYKKLISSSLWVRRLPSYLSRDQLISIVQELYKARKQLETEFSEISVETEESSKSWVENLQDYISSWWNRTIDSISNWIKHLKKPKSINNLIISELKKNNNQDRINNNIEPPSILSNDIFWWRRFHMNVFSSIYKWMRRTRHNKLMIARNLSVLEQKLNQIKEPKLAKALDIIKSEHDPSIRILEADLTQSKEDLSIIYDDFMNRATGWFKRKVQLYLIVIGFIIAFYTNADTLAIFEKLSNDPLARSEVVSLAENFVESDGIEKYLNATNDTSKVDSLISNLGNLLNDEFSGTRTLIGLGWGFNRDSLIYKDSERDTLSIKNTTDLLSQYFIFDTLILVESKEGLMSFKPWKWRGTISHTDTLIFSFINDTLITHSINDTLITYSINSPLITYSNDDTFITYSVTDTLYIGNRKDPVQFITYPHRLANAIFKKTSKQPSKWFGFLLTALAISLGATFWFDLLKLLINIRNAGKRPAELAGSVPQQGQRATSNISSGQSQVSRTSKNKSEDSDDIKIVG